MMALRSFALMPLVALMIVVAGCGGGGDKGGTTGAAAVTVSAEPLSTSIKASANSNCRQMTRGAEALARGPARLGTGKYSSNLDQLLNGFIRPGIPLFERLSDQQRALEPQADNPGFTRYADLFDPIVVLAQQMLRAGPVNTNEGVRLNRLLTHVTIEQRREAQALGLSDCAVDLQKIVTSAYQ
jgi:hypothetical protein